MTPEDQDSSLIIETLLKLKNNETIVDTHVFVIPNVEDILNFQARIITAPRKCQKHENYSFCILLVTPWYQPHPTISLSCHAYLLSQEESSGARLNMTFIRNALKESAAISEGMDILF